MARSRRGAWAGVGMRFSARDRVVDHFGSGEAIVPRTPGGVAQNGEVSETQRQEAQDQGEHPADRATEGDLGEP